MSADNIRNLMSHTEPAQSGISYRCASEIQIKPINWLWKGRIARGKVSMIAGDPGLGKSQLSISIAAIVVNGGFWPVDKTSCEQGKVIFLSAEDAADDTIVPRLKAVKADINNVYIIDAVLDVDATGNQISKQFNLGTDLNRLDSMLTSLGNVALIIIDPITAYLGDSDSYKTSDVRALMAPLSKLAEKHNVAIVCISHLNKARTNDALSRVTGSLAFVAAVRAAFVVVKDKIDQNKRLMLPLKNNIGNDQTGFAFTLENSVIDDQIETSRICWSPESVSITASEALSAQEGSDQKSALEEAEEFLCDLLVNGAVPATKIKRASDAAGHAWATIRRAKDNLKIKPKKIGTEWQWELLVPTLQQGEDAQDDQGAHTKNLSTMSTLPRVEQTENDCEVF
jgi:putative DNA primase/helicase